MPRQAIQDAYPAHFAQCYGCGSQNEHGLHLRSYWEDDESVAHFTPEPYHTVIPGYVYGGLIASIIDCHGTGTAAAAAYRAEGKELGGELPMRFFTAALHVDYLKPTPLGPTLELRGRVSEIKGRKVVVEITLAAEGQICARGQVVAVQVPDQYIEELLEPETAND